ncbi:MAG: hypothetical protein P4M11_13190 [Candidatus Pacebacteria bacterium]|nr:hypothetical protein [Candidatus Paceibacterota bacterium]
MGLKKGEEGEKQIMPPDYYMILLTWIKMVLKGAFSYISPDIAKCYYLQDVDLARRVCRSE